ncbi:nitrite reductase (NO-forming) [Kribbella sp. VKM Ac-2571]|uniref:multicopper oxidase domain-containing protein n=1 Tax=Kribbella sp. VKM Ac-2571 TaxID=2512222 RepID=UPI0010DC8A7B|nr:multicopper oxidase domain-containing protein [Kribbella sp. VKM Ac-2571]TDO44186.1 nitrite reductase (NO-forming) [Kribbella sp. VKM Ac-2571]
MSTTNARGFWPLRDLPVLFWLIGTIVVAILHPFLPAPRWLMIHLLLLGAVSHAILVWSRYFADALLHTPTSDRAGQSRRLLLLNGGVLAVVAGVVSSTWAITAAGAAAVATAVLWHGWVLVGLIRSALAARFGATVRFYVAAACFLPVGATLGSLLARDLPDPWHARVVLAHAAVNLLGWVGLTVAGTLVTLWPTMLRTRIAEGAEKQAAQALPVLIAAVLVTAGSAAAGSRMLTAVGLLAYVVGLAQLGRAFLNALSRNPPRSFPADSVLAALLWLVGVLLVLAVGIGTAGSWSGAGRLFEWLTPFLAAGFGAQVLLGALSYLVPVALGGGPTAIRAANAALDRGSPLRIVVTNLGLLVCVLPAPSAVRAVTSVAVLCALASWLPLLVLALRASRRAKAEAAASLARGDKPSRSAEPRRPAGQVAGLAVTGAAVVALVVAAGVAVDPSALGRGTALSAAGEVSATGHTTTVQVAARDLRFQPSTVTVPAGDRVVIVLTNVDDEDVHDLLLDSGARTRRLSPGQSTRLDVGVVGRAIDGWCSVIGHRQLGMTFHIDTTPAAGSSQAGHGVHAHGPGAQAETGGQGDGSGDAAGKLDFMAKPPPGFEAVDAALPPLGSARVQRRTFVIRDVVREVAPGVTQRLWTYDGTMPGPVLHGRVGDSFEITLVNRGSIGHSIDFHAGALSPQGPMRTIAPGDSLVYRFRATRAGVWLYHCSTMPMSAHIANGLFGAVIIEPPNLPNVARSYVLVQSEFYLGDQAGLVDVTKVQSERPDAVVFNGYANQYDHKPLAAKPGDRVRVWVLDAGPNRSSSFHVVGAQFDTAYSEGAYLLRGGQAGAQSLGLQAGQGGFVDLTFPESGDYPFVSHVMVDAERGAHGSFHVSP